jgi:hypothetical protein
MPIRPIDLQTLLMQMSQVGRDQAVEKDGPILQSAMQGAATLKKEGEAKESVRKAEDAKQGPDPVKDQRGKQRRKGSKAEGEEAEGEEAPPEEIVRDPDLGGRVDLSG